MLIARQKAGTEKGLATSAVTAVSKLSIALTCFAMPTRFSYRLPERRHGSKTSSISFSSARITSECTNITGFSAANWQAFRWRRTRRIAIDLAGRNVRLVCGKVMPMPPTLSAYAASAALSNEIKPQLIGPVVRLCTPPSRPCNISSPAPIATPSQTDSLSIFEGNEMFTRLCGKEHQAILGANSSTCSR